MKLRAQTFVTKRAMTPEIARRELVEMPGRNAASAHSDRRKDMTGRANINRLQRSNARRPSEFSAFPILSINTPNAWKVERLR
mmetsp:Transcript_6995/g.11044  ORF Transcript_6995/g.11044 Transcript_6995/m.11044 type:complete len:83 (-) Transcript_6995:222-470(-)